MPYIVSSIRYELEGGLMFLSRQIKKNPGPGVLNYIFTRLIKIYFELNHNYQGINDILGALEGAKLEFYRRQVVDYENEKIKQNGDVY